MATVTETKLEDSSTAEAGWSPYRLTVRQFLAMIDANVFPDDANVELLGGMLIETMVKGDPRDFSLDVMAEKTPADDPGRLATPRRQIAPARPAHEARTRRGNHSGTTVAVQ